MYQHINGYLWLITGVYWFVQWKRVRRTKVQETSFSRLRYLAVVISGLTLLMNNRTSVGWLSWRWLPQTAAWGVASVAVTTCGLAFAIWARGWLGENWSAVVTLKENHQLIRTGPYRFARHPIYTGLILGALGEALSVGEIRALIGLALILGAALRKIGIEERFLTREFGQIYGDYQKSVKKLIPFIY